MKQVSGFNHAYSPTDFARFYAANDKPLIYHFEDGNTLVMNKQTDGYVAVAGDKMYVLNNEGMNEIVIGGGGIYYLPDTINIYSELTGDFTAEIVEIIDAIKSGKVIASKRYMGQGEYSVRNAIGYTYNEDGSYVNLYIIDGNEYKNLTVTRARATPITIASWS